MQEVKTSAAEAGCSAREDVYAVICTAACNSKLKYESACARESASLLMRARTGGLHDQLHPRLHQKKRLAMTMFVWDSDSTVACQTVFNGLSAESSSPHSRLSHSTVQTSGDFD